MTELDTFVETRCYLFPTGKVKFADFVAHFRASLTPAQQRRFPRSVIASALRQRFAVGRDATQTLFVGGLSLTPPPQYVVNGGRLRLQPAVPMSLAPPRLGSHLR